MVAARSGLVWMIHPRSWIRLSVLKRLLASSSISRTMAEKGVIACMSDGDIVVVDQTPDPIPIPIDTSGN